MVRAARAAMGASLVFVFGLGGFGLGGCAAPRASGNGEPAPGREAPVATVGEARVSKADLSDFFFARFREPYYQALDELVDERILASEQRRLSVSVSPAALDAAVEAETKARAGLLKARFGDRADLASSVRETYGLDLPTWTRDVLRPRLAVNLLLQRVVRLSARTREEVSCRAIVVKDRAKAAAIREKADHGADFTLMALAESEDPSKAEGGLLPAIARGDLLRPEVEQALFSAAPGAVVGPLEVATDAGTEYHVYRVVERVPAWSGEPAALAARLESDLAASPVTRPEYERWAGRARRQFGVRYFAPDGSVLRLPEKGR